MNRPGYAKLALVLTSIGVTGCPTIGSAAQTTTIPSCTGPHDLLIDTGAVSLEGKVTYDRVCVENGASLYTSTALSLRVGTLYVAPRSSIMSNGEDGYAYTNHDCSNSLQEPNGTNGGSITITARHAIIQGRIAANGGQGISNNTVVCGTTAAVGHGGNGGTIRLTALDLGLSGTMSVQGGNGGSIIDTPDPGTTLANGNGGKGGSITLTTSITSTILSAHLIVRGGDPGRALHAVSGKQGSSGSATITPLPSNVLQTIPAEPPPLITFLRPLPRQSIVDATTTTSYAVCSAGDLIVGDHHVVRLRGVHAYRHICVNDGGAIVGTNALTLVATEVYVAPRGHISVDGQSPLFYPATGSGNYESHGPCTASHVPPHSGVPGKAGTLYGDTYATNAANPGGGGGMLTIIAHSATIMGYLSALGGKGQTAPSAESGNTFSREPSGTDGNGGSGGGMYLVVPTLTLGGSISVMGGSGGHATGVHGTSGCIKVFTNNVRSLTQQLPLVGPAIVGRIISTDPRAKTPSYQTMKIHVYSGSSRGDKAVAAHQE